MPCGPLSQIVTIDPFGHVVLKEYAPFLQQGYDIRPTIAGTRRSSLDFMGIFSQPRACVFAVTKAHIELPELMQSVQSGRTKPDGVVLMKSGQANVTKVRPAGLAVGTPSVPSSSYSCCDVCACVLGRCGARVVPARRC